MNPMEVASSEEISGNEIFKRKIRSMPLVFLFILFLTFTLGWFSSNAYHDANPPLKIEYIENNNNNNIDCKTNNINSPISNNLTNNTKQEDPKNNQDITSFNPLIFNTYSPTQCSKYSKTLQKIVQKKEEIISKWDVKRLPLFYKSIDLDEKSWNIFKLNILNAVLQENFANKESFSTKSSQTTQKFPSNFVIGVTGSSVNAGHDNYINETISFLLNDSLYDVFTSINVKLDVRNVAIGNNPCIPYDICALTHAGRDLDILLWEQSFNCGRSTSALESFTRNFYQTSTDKLTSIFYYLSGNPFWNSNICTSSYDENFDPSVHTNPSFNKNDYEEIALIKSKLILYKEKKFVTPLDEKLSKLTFKAIANKNDLLKTSHALNDNNIKISEAYHEISLVEINVGPLNEYKCIGPYTKDFAVKSPGGGAQWHPGRLGHQLRSDIMSFLILSILEEVIVDLTNIGCSSSGKDSLRKLSVETKFLNINRDNLKDILIENFKLFNLDKHYSAYLTEDLLENIYNKYVSNTISQIKTEQSLAVSNEKKNNFLLLLTFIQTWIPYLKNNSSLVPNSSKLIKSQYNFKLNPHYKSHKELYSTNIKCITDFEPRVEKDYSISNHVVLSHPYYSNNFTAKSNKYNDQYTSYINSLQSISLYNYPFNTYNYYSYNYLSKDVIKKINDHYNKKIFSSDMKDINILTENVALGISFLDENGINKSLQRGIVYNDLKYIYITKDKSSKLTFSVKVFTNPSPIWFCQVQKGFSKYPSSIGELDESGNFDAFINYDPMLDLSQQHIISFSKLEIFLI